MDDKTYEQRRYEIARELYVSDDHPTCQEAVERAEALLAALGAGPGLCSHSRVASAPTSVERYRGLTVFGRRCLFCGTEVEPEVVSEPECQACDTPLAELDEMFARGLSCPAPGCPVGREAPEELSRLVQHEDCADEQ